MDFQGKESLDEQTRCKRGFLEKIRQRHSRTPLEDRVDPKQNFIWPRHFLDEDNEPDKDSESAFPLPENSYIGIIHADGNGLGGIVKKLIESLDAHGLQHVLFAFSEAVRKATCDATCFAVNQVLGKYVEKIKAHEKVAVPARPLVVGGDDWSFIARGDLALDFTEAYLEAFEAETEKAFAALSATYPKIKLPPRLTACAGIAFVKPKQPFHQAYALAESLCKYAKTRAKPQDSNVQTPSALAFYRLTNSQIDDYETIIERELTAGDIVLTMQPYFIGQGMEPNLSELFNLADNLKKPRISRGATRELLDLLHTDLNHARQRFERWRENLRGDDEGRKLAKEIKETLRKLTAQADKKDDLDFSDLFGNTPRSTKKETPLSDALALNGIRKGGEYDD